MFITVLAIFLLYVIFFILFEDFDRRVWVPLSDVWDWHLLGVSLVLLAILVYILHRYASRMDEPSAMRCDLVGRCCESGDVIQPDILLPNSTQRGDVVAVCTTGAYNFSMASGYNRMLRPPVVMLKEGRSYVAVGRETLDDLIRLDQ